MVGRHFGGKRHPVFGIVFREDSLKGNKAVYYTATIEDLYRVEEKAELIEGCVVRIPPTGGEPRYAGDEVFVSLRTYAKQTGSGRAVGDNKAFQVTLPNRGSFSPDAAFHIGKLAGIKFYDGAPVFAVEVRSEGDYGSRAEQAMIQKRMDYFAAATLVVWDVDLLAEDYVINVYRADDPSNPTGYRRGEIAEAEPAVPSWRMAVDDLFS